MVNPFRYLTALRTVRLRLTLAHGALFAVSGAVLLVITYLLVRSSSPSCSSTETSTVSSASSRSVSRRPFSRTCCSVGDRLNPDDGHLIHARLVGGRENAASAGGEPSASRFRHLIHAISHGAAAQPQRAAGMPAGIAVDAGQKRIYGTHQMVEAMQSTSEHPADIMIMCSAHAWLQRTSNGTDGGITRPATVPFSPSSVR